MSVLSSTGRRRRLPTLTDPQRARASYRWICVAAVAVVLLLAFRQSATLPATLGSTWTLVIMVACSVAWVIARATGDGDPAARSDAWWLVPVAYLGVSVLSYGAAMHRGIPAGADATTMDASLILELVSVCFVGFLLTNLVEFRAVELLIRCIVIGLSISASYAVLNIATGLDLGALLRPPLTRPGGTVLTTDLLREGMVRAQGAAGHPLELSALVTVAIPLSLGLFFAARVRGRRAWPWACCFLVLAAATVLSLSRSAIGGCLLAVVLMACFWPMRRTVSTALVLAVGLLAAIAAKPTLFATILKVFASSGTDDSLYSREFGRGYAMQFITAHPWLGIGNAAYSVPFNPVLDNQYLGRLVEAGGWGLLTFIALLGVPLALAARTAHALPRAGTTEPAAMRELAVGTVGGCAALVTNNLVLDTAGFPQAWALMWIMFALAVAMWRLVRRAGTASTWRSGTPDMIGSGSVRAPLD